ncbi:ASST-domain-containing protein [Exophiala viscosa]|uniref:ASST-domain-containing protein n=1 Tax=Exophiala viscosa TaxID=2486360 RepID=UPI00218C9999|nr:ASST-domain-containing protein [Exophiala viscosa]
MERVWMIILVLCLRCTFAIDPIRGPTQGDDLHRYVTRPEIRPPRLGILHSEPERLTPGYWFVAPYVGIRGGDRDARFIPFQIGPHIYRSDGELVWSGAEIVNNRNTFDFRVQSVSGKPALTYIMAPGNERDKDRQSYGVILDSSYRPWKKVKMQENGWIWNLHEFFIYNETTSISVMEEGKMADVSSFNLPQPEGPIWQYGFHETDVNTKKTTYQWRPLKHNVTTAESMIKPPNGWLAGGPGWQNPHWDCYHINSIDKNAEGDFLVSMRYTSTIYKLSGKHGSVIWRLGGKHSDFKQDFRFSSQHFARFYSQNGNETIISFLDNGSDEENRQPQTAKTSSIKLVSLIDDGKTKKATLLKHFDRPDGKLTRLRGSAQALPNGGFAAGWSESGYISEFAPDGHTVFEARFTTDRFNTYRAYKFEFVGSPKEAPVLKTFALSNGNDDVLANMSTSFYVSWNGATEVHSWDFYVTNNKSMVGHEAQMHKAGSVNSTSFETSFLTNEFWAYAYVEARDKFNRTLGRSSLTTVILPGGLQREYNESTLAVEAGVLQVEWEQRQQRPKTTVRILPVISVVGLSFITLGLIGFWAVKKFEVLAALVRHHGHRLYGEDDKELDHEWSKRRDDRFLEDWTQQKDALLKSFAVYMDDDESNEKEEAMSDISLDEGGGSAKRCEGV